MGRKGSMISTIIVLLMDIRSWNMLKLLTWKDNLLFQKISGLVGIESAHAEVPLLNLILHLLGRSWGKNKDKSGCPKDMNTPYTPPKLKPSIAKLHVSAWGNRNAAFNELWRCYTSTTFFYEVRYPLATRCALARTEFETRPKNPIIVTIES